MDLTPTAEQRAFRAECRAWLRDNLPWDYGAGLPPLFDDLAEEVGFGRRWQRSLADAGYVGVTWPAAYGGRGADAVFSFIVQEELARARAPELVGRIGVNLVGPCLLAHGTSDQKQRWLPTILGAEQLFCQLFSEPDAGSDLASLRTCAEPDGDGWRLRGRKVWTSYAQFADWGLCLARTDPEASKRAGITVFLVDMRVPGVEVRPLRQMTGESDFNEVFARLCRAMDRPELPTDERFGSPAARRHNRDEVNQTVAEWAAALDAATIEERCLRHGVPVGIVYNVADLAADEHVRARGDLYTVDDPVIGPVRQQAPFPRFDDHLPPAPAGAPRLGEHTDEVLSSLLGLSGTELEALRADGVI